VDKSANFVDNYCELCKSRSFSFHLYYSFRSFWTSFLLCDNHERGAIIQSSNAVHFSQLTTSKGFSYQQERWMSYEHQYNLWIRKPGYAPATWITYPPLWWVGLNSIFSSPLSRSFSTPDIDLSPIYTSQQIMWVTYPPGIKFLYRLIFEIIKSQISVACKQYPHIHHAYYYYDNIYIFVNQRILVDRTCGQSG